MDNVEERIKIEVLEAMHEFTGNDFSFSHNDEDDTLKVTEYTEEGEILRHLKVTVSIGVEVVG